MTAINFREIIQEMLIPEFDSVKVKIESEVKRLDQRIDSVSNEVNVKLDSLDRRMDYADKRIDSLRSEFVARFDAIDSRFDSIDRDINVSINIHERLAALEAKIGLRN